MPFTAIREFFRMEAAGGIVLVIAAALAIWVANSPLAPYYQQFLEMRLAISVDTFAIDKPLHLWINDGLMAVFFMLVGLEIKREFVTGELSRRDDAVLPFVAAIGGMAAPALIFVALNAGNSQYLYGWAIPAATDIAFALTVLTLLGSRVPLSLKVFLTAVAIIDDLGAIVIIAVFYTYDLSYTSLGLAALALVGLLVLNLCNVTKLAPYLVVGAILWVCVLKSGVHATLAGVALAMAIPLRERSPEEGSLLKHCEHGLHPWVAFAILPLFGFANAGVSFEGMTWAKVFDTLPLGIAVSLFFGKQLGVFGFTWIAAKTGLARRPEGASWPQVYGAAVICGIGFTMSLFIGGLAWDHTDYEAGVRLGVIAGSILSVLWGVIVLMMAPPQRVGE